MCVSDIFQENGKVATIFGESFEIKVEISTRNKKKDRGAGSGLDRPEQVRTENRHGDGEPAEHGETHERVDLRDPGQAVPDPFNTVSKRVDERDRCEIRWQAADREERSRETENREDDEVHDQLETCHVIHPRRDRDTECGKCDPDQGHETERDEKSHRTLAMEPDKQGEHEDNHALDKRRRRSAGRLPEHDLQAGDRGDKGLFQKPELFVPDNLDTARRPT